MMEDPYEELANSYEVRKVQRWKQFSEAFHKRFVEGDKSSDWRKPLSDKLDDIYEFNSCYNKLLAENGLEDGDDGDEEENMADCDVESDVSSEKNSEFMPRTNTQQSAPGPINSIKRRAAFLQKYGPHSSSNSPPSDDIEEETFFLLKSVDGKGVKSKKVRIRASNGSIACSTEDRSCNSMISKQKGKYKSRDSFQAKENGDEAVKTPSGLWEVDENKGSLLENRDTEDNDIKKRHVRKECSSSEVTVSVNSENPSVLKLKDDSTSVKGRELNDILSLLDETILSDSSGKRITRSRLRATCTPVAALKPSSLSFSTSASLFPNETSDQSADSISVLSEAPTQIFTSVNPRKVNNKGGLTNMSECAKNGAVRTASSTPNRVVPPQPQELSDLFSPIQSSSKNLGAAIQSNSVKVNDEANSNQLFTPQNFENCVRQAVTLILSTFIPNLAASQGQPNTEQRPASNAESLNAQQQQISSSNLAWSNLLLQNPFFTPGSISNLLSGSGLVHQPTPQEKIHLKSPIMGSNAFGDDSGALRSRELTLVKNKSAGTLQLEVPIVEKRSLSSKVSNESQQTSPILSSNVSSDNMSLRSRRSVLKRGKSINKKKPLAPKTVNETGQVDLESSLFTSKYDYTPQRSGERSLPKEATAEKFQFRTPIAQKKTLTPKSTKKSMDDDLEGPIPNTNASEEENKSPKSRRLTTPRKCVSCSDCSSETPRQAFKDSSQFSKATKRKLWEPIESTSESGGKKIHRKRSRLVAPNLIKSSKINKNISRHHFRKQKEILKSKKKFENPKLSLRSQFPGESKQSASGTRKAKVSEERNKKAHLRDTRRTMDDLRFKTFSSRIRDLSAKTERQPLRNLSGLPSSIANALRESDSDDDDGGADFLLHL